MLTVKQLSVSYGKRKAVSNLSIELNEGEIVTIMGANGAGKSTTLRALAGLLPATGTIQFRGQDLTSLAPYRRVAHGLVLVPEGRQLFSSLTVEEHLDLGYLQAPRNGRSKKVLLERCLTLFPIIGERARQAAGTMSGGQQQMVAIARGLMSDPKLLMLDEPTLGLAPLVIDTLADAFLKLRKDGLTILLVEQRVDLALDIADRGYVLETGNIRVSGSSNALRENPAVREAFLGL